MAHIYRLIAQIIFLFLISSHSFAVEKVPDYYFATTEKYHHFSDKTSACKAYVDYQYRDDTEYSFLGTLYDYLDLMCHYRATNKVTGHSSEEYVSAVSYQLSCPKNSKKINGWRDFSCSCNAGYLDKGNSCEPITCPTGANWNEDAKACLCSDGMQPSGDMCTTPESPPPEVNSCKAGQKITREYPLGESPQTAFCEFGCIYTFILDSGVCMGIGFPLSSEFHESCVFNYKSTGSYCNSSGLDDDDSDSGGGGSGGSGNCRKNDSGECYDEGDTFDGTCESDFECEGDVIQCAIAKEQHIRNCKMFEDKSDESDLYEKEKGKEGNQTEDLENNKEIDINGKIDTSNALGSGFCIN